MIVAFLKFLRRRVDGKHLMRFISEKADFKFLLRGVEGAWITRGPQDESFIQWMNVEEANYAIYWKAILYQWIHVIHSGIST